MSVLSPIARHEYYAELGNTLPEPVLNEPEIRQRRLTTAVETFEALRPGDAYEARLAVKIVLCGALAVENMREANVHREDFPKRMRCLSQAAGMMREERAARRMLLREQKVRLAGEEVAGNAPVRPAAAVASPSPADPRAAPPPAPVPPAVPPLRAAATQAAAPPPSAEAIAKAEAFAHDELCAAVQIRHDGGVTPQNTAFFRHVTMPTDPALIDALVRGTTDCLTFLDEVGGETLDEAA
jgi:hypothetical protein